MIFYLAFSSSLISITFYFIVAVEATFAFGWLEGIMDGPRIWDWMYIFGYALTLVGYLAVWARSPLLRGRLPRRAVLAAGRLVVIYPIFFLFEMLWDALYSATGEGFLLLVALPIYFLLPAIAALFRVKTEPPLVPPD